MRRRFIASVSAAAGVTTVLCLTALPLDGQGGSTAVKPGGAPAGWTAPRTAWGDPDLEGIWSYATITPLERPDRYAGREFLTREEMAALNADAASAGDRRSDDPQADVAGAYNAFWWDRGASTGRTSLIVDPPNGKLPALTPEAERRRAAVAADRRGHEFDSWENRPLQERCLTYHGVPPLPTGYNNHYQIVQAPGIVAILDENIHDVRTIPLDGRPHLPPGVRQWNGDSRGRWEGDTLVVETTNYHEKTTFRFPTASETLRAVERFRRVGPDTIDYRYTIDDRGTYARPWTVELPLSRIEGPIFEYACHEGNYSLPHVLAGARAGEKQAEEPGSGR
jgi:hypothetical protein